MPRSSQAPPALAILCVTAALVALGAAGFASVQARRAWPIELQEVLDAQDERVRAAEAIGAGLQSKWAAKVAELAALEEEIEGVLDAIERKRRRIATTEQHAQAREQGAQDQLPADPGARRAAIAQLARSKGFRV